MVTSVRPPHAVVAPTGELDVFSCQTLKQQLDDLVACGCTDLLLDASGLTFADGSALGTLERFRRRLGAAGGRLLVVAASVPFLRVCHLAGYDELAPPGCERDLPRRGGRPTPSPA